MSIEKCEDCHEQAEVLCHCSCGKWVCFDCGWYRHWRPNAQQSMHPTSGTLRGLDALSTPEANPAPEHLSIPPTCG